MFLTRSEYDRGVNTFSPEGRLFQVEYAIEAIKLGSTALGITCKEGVVIAVERRVTSPLMEPSSIEKLFEIDSHIGCAMSGILADARTLVDHARSEAQNHRFTFNEPIRTQSVAQSVCDLALNFGEGDGSQKKPMARPYGVALLISGVDINGPVLFNTDPSGTLFKYKAKAIGSAAEGAQTILEEEWNENLTLDQSIKLAAKILKQVMEEAITAFNIEIAVIPITDGKYFSLPVDQVSEILRSLS
jgi:20S proteasome subunit alpha 5